MPKVQVLVTVTAEALVEVPQDVQDVEAYCREHVGLAWGGLDVASVVQPPAISIDYFPIPEPVEEVADGEEVEVAPEAVSDVSEPEALEPVVAAVASESVEEETQADRVVSVDDILARFDDPQYSDVIRSAIRARAAQLIEEVVSQVVAELEPLLQRHLARKPDGVK